MTSWLQDVDRLVGGAARLTGARVAASLLPPSVAAEAARDRDGFALVDLAIGDGMITDVVPSGTTDVVPSGTTNVVPSGTWTGAAVALGGKHVWPAFVDIHTHYDKGHIWPRSPNPDGSHPGAARTVAADRAAHWKEADIAARFDFGLRCAWAHGTAAIRTHIDSYVMSEARRGWAVFEEQRAAWAGRITVQGVTMARVDQYAGDDAGELVALAAKSGGCLGGILRTAAFADPEPQDRIDACLDAMLGRAAAEGLDIDLHIDESGDTDADGLRAVARAVLRNRFTGSVNCGHCCALSIQSAQILEQTIAMAGESGISVTSLPMANLYLQDRQPGRTPRWRGIAPVHELAAGGVHVCASSDNCRDPFFMFGDHDMLETWREFVRIAHLDLAPGVWAASVTRRPADAMRLADHGRIEPGARADLLLFRARTVSELLARPQSDRIVLRRGQVCRAVLPQYAELDGLQGMV